MEKRGYKKGNASIKFSVLLISVFVVMGVWVSLANVSQDSGLQLSPIAGVPVFVLALFALVAILVIGFSLRMAFKKKEEEYYEV